MLLHTACRGPGPLHGSENTHVCREVCERYELPSAVLVRFSLQSSLEEPGAKPRFDKGQDEENAEGRVAEPLIVLRRRARLPRLGIQHAV